MFNCVKQDDKYILHFKYDPALIAIVKAVPGRQWNPQGKYWSIPVSHLGWLIKGIKGTPYKNAMQIISDEQINENASLDSTDKIPDIDISDVDHYVKEGFHLYQHQLDFLKYAKNKGQKGFILADDMGCVSGDAIVTVNVGGGSKKMTLEKLYNRFHRLTPQSKRSNNPEFYVRCYKEDLGIFGLNRMRDIKFSGIKPVYRMTLSDGKSIKVTADHEICTPNGYVELQNLVVGDAVVVNGTLKCINCGSADNIITYKYAKFYGYCKSCMYRLRDGTINKGDSVGRRIDKGGYVVLNGKKFRGHPNYKNDGIYEHHYVMSQIIGRPIGEGEIVHHIDGNKQNNSPENLQLLTVSAHAKLHSNENTKNLWCDYVSRGNTIIVVPKYATISSIEYVGDEATYDIVMENPYRNFIANGIVVHNCGKTLEILNFAMYQRKRYRYKHCLIITCVNSAKYSWQEDIDKHTNGTEQAYILGTRVIKRGKRKGRLRYNGSGPDKVADLNTGHMYGDESAPELPYFIVTNIESLGRTKAGKQFILAERIIDMIKRGDISIIAIDECHKNMSPKSTQGKVILDIKKRTGKMIQWIPMTGTPIKNKPIDVFTPLKLVDGHEIKNFFQWSQQFCIFGGYGGYEIMGYKNIPMLKDMLQGNMIRRLKTEVLDLPPKIYFNEYVELTPYQEDLYEAIEEEIYEHKEEILESVNPLTAMLRLRQITGSPELVDNTLVVDDAYLACNAKLIRLIEIIDDCVERGEKAIVFSNWVEPLRTVYKFLSKKHKTCCYTGTMSETDREKHKRVFINNPEYKVMLGTMGAMGVSLTLTVATNVIFFDDCWTPADKEQAEDRANRIGSTNPLNVYTLMAKDTIDERVRQILEQKRGIANFIVDNKLDLKANPKLFDFLLGREK